jgi:DNA-binding response OmpR family regulator
VKVEADPAGPRRILTVWGLGYKFSPELTEERGQ